MRENDDDTHNFMRMDYSVYWFGGKECSIGF